MHSTRSSSTSQPAFGFEWENPHRTVRRPILAERMVVASQPLAAQAGVRMLAQGGNAVDAAIAAAAVLAVVEPTNNGLGSDAFAQVVHQGRVFGLNASGRAPRHWTREHFAGLRSMPERGWRSVTVPGAVAGWCELASRFATLPLRVLLQPAIDYARHGFHVAPAVAEKWAQQAVALSTQPGFAAAFCPGNRVPVVGERFRLPELAATLERIADTAGRDFYAGDTARRILEFAAATGGALEAEDFASYRPLWVEPLKLDYRGVSLLELPPNGQGVVAQMALGILDHFPLEDDAPDSPAVIHLQIEALKLAFADARRWIGDPDTLPLDPARLLDRDYLASRARLIHPRRAQEYGPGIDAGAGTVYLAAADDAGCLVSLIQSNYMGFGSGVVVPGTGVSLQNRGACFTLERGHPNEVGPGKRPYHTILPGLLLREGNAFAAFGSTGGLYQPQGHVQVVVRLAHYGLNPQSIVDAPRFRVVGGLKVNFEPGFPQATLEALAEYGHEIHAQPESSWDFGGMQMIVRAGDGWLAATDSRRDSHAAGF